jgi:hypothetical protein
MLSPQGGRGLSFHTTRPAPADESAVARHPHPQGGRGLSSRTTRPAPADESAVAVHSLPNSEKDCQLAIPEKGQTRPAQGLSGRIVGLLYNPGRVGGLVCSGYATKLLRHWELFSWPAFGSLRTAMFALHLLPLLFWRLGCFARAAATADAWRPLTSTRLIG